MFPSQLVNLLVKFCILGFLKTFDSWVSNTGARSEVESQIFSILTDFGDIPSEMKKSQWSGILSLSTGQYMSSLAVWTLSILFAIRYMSNFRALWLSLLAFQIITRRRLSIYFCPTNKCLRLSFTWVWKWKNFCNRW